MIYLDKSKYDGYFENGVRNGKGILNLKDGSSY